MTETFYSRIEQGWNEGRFVCVGLDTVYERLPEAVKSTNSAESVLNFNKAIVNACAEYACAFKPNSSFYERLGTEGMETLRLTIAYIKATYPKIPVILDSKRGDIDSSSDGYAYSTFELMKADAVTVSPYLGKGALKPFLERKDKGIIVLGANSNPGSGEFQDLKVKETNEPLYLHVVRSVAEEWNENRNCAVTAGATQPEKIKNVRSVIGEMPILLLGVGAQGGNLDDSVKSGKAKDSLGLIINSSRTILYASSGPDYAEKSAKAAKSLNEAIGAALN